MWHLDKSAWVRVDAFWLAEDRRCVDSCCVLHWLAVLKTGRSLISDGPMRVNLVSCHDTCVSHKWRRHLIPQFAEFGAMPIKRDGAVSWPTIDRHCNSQVKLFGQIFTNGVPGQVKQFTSLRAKWSTLMLSKWVNWIKVIGSGDRRHHVAAVIWAAPGCRMGAIIRPSRN